MSEHPISEILKISMNSIREMIDANTIIGEVYKIWRYYNNTYI